MKFRKFLLPLLAVLTIALVCIFVLPQQAQAATEGYYTYEVTDGEATITDCDISISGDITIPSTLGGYPVTSITSAAYSTTMTIARNGRQLYCVVTDKYGNTVKTVTVTLKMK